VGAVAMPVELTDRSNEFQSAYDRAAYTALSATARHLKQQVQYSFVSKNYYKGGAFRSTLQIVQSIGYKPPVRGMKGWETVVGTKHIVALYWELGHHNAFTRKFERVEIWKPTMLRERQAMRAMFGATLRRLLPK